MKVTDKYTIIKLKLELGNEITGLSANPLKRLTVNYYTKKEEANHIHISIDFVYGLRKVT